MTDTRTTSGPKDRAKILQIAWRLDRAGAETRLIEIMGRLDPGEFEVHVCAVSGLPGVLDDAVRRSGGEVILLRLDWAFPLRFVRLLRQARYDIVQSHLLHTSGVILALAAIAGVPVRIAHFRNTFDGRRSTVRRRIQRRAMCALMNRFATDIVGCGEGALDGIWGESWRTDQRCRVIHNTVDTSRFEGLPRPEQVRAQLGLPVASTVFLHLGRESADRQKNHRRLLQIFLQIHHLDPAARLVLAGAGTDDPAGEAARAIEELGLDGAVLALGVREDVPDLLAAADALLLPSLWEGLPGVVLEACAAAVPVLASDLPGVREIACRLPMVRRLSLDASDLEWAHVALALPEEAKRSGLRERAHHVFRESVFHVDRGVDAHRSLWSRGAASERQRLGRKGTRIVGGSRRVSDI